MIIYEQRLNGLRQKSFEFPFSLKSPDDNSRNMINYCNSPLTLRGGNK